MYKKNQGRTILVWENECFFAFAFALVTLKKICERIFP